MREGQIDELLTSLLFSASAFVADFDRANGEHDGHDEEEDSADESCSDRSSLHVIGHRITKSIARCVSRG